MGKSFVAKEVLASEYNALYAQIDRVYSTSCLAAQSIIPGVPGGQASDAAAAKESLLPALISKLKKGISADPIAERLRLWRDSPLSHLRRFARDRRWPSAEIEHAFFKAFENEISELLRNARNDGVPVVLEGGTLRRRDEAEIALRAAASVFEGRARLVRLSVRVPYEQWLRNRVNRMHRSKVETVKLQKLSPEAYEREVKQAEPEPDDRIAEFSAGSVDDVRALMTKLEAEGIVRKTSRE
jgi:transcriptional regulator with XRE-family HTH domain